MKSIKTFLLLLFVGISFCSAQDTTLLLKPSMFDKDTMRIYISEMHGWLFKQGNDTAWAGKDIDLTGWKKLRPTELTEKLADKKGKIEGWFRLKIKLDESFKSIPLGLNTATWAASDVYLDGQWLGSTGNTGSNGEPFKENRLSFGFTIQLDLSPGKEYTIAFHVVDYVSPFPPARLKSEDAGLPFLITLTGPKFILAREESIIKWKIYPTIWNAVCVVLSLLFWLLYAQNTKEKNLRLIALCVTLLTLNLFCNYATNIADLSFVNKQLLYFGSLLFGTLSFSMIPLILAYAFKRKVTAYLKIYLMPSFLIVSVDAAWFSNYLT